MRAGTFRYPLAESYLLMAFNFWVFCQSTKPKALGWR